MYFIGNFPEGLADYLHGTSWFICGLPPKILTGFLYVCRIHI
jgi:hypothetical protein